MVIISASGNKIDNNLVHEAEYVPISSIDLILFFKLIAAKRV